MLKHLLTILILMTALPAMAATCNYSDCHSDISEQQIMHSPVADGDCTTCHYIEDDDIAKHEEDPEANKPFESPVGEDENLCLMCHDPVDGKSVVHSPVAENDCTTCHNPHGGENPYMMPEATEADLCFYCHENNLDKEYIHGPLAVGECTVCHSPHASDNVYQLKQPKERLCVECHTAKEESMNVKYKHAPVLEDCTQCHTPHSSDYDMFLTSDLKDHCFDCHSDLGEMIDSKEYKHAPVEYDGCSACHNVHGSENPFMLYEFFPETFYNDYEDGMYKLCFECHNVENIQTATTDSGTEFRNGTQNLHYFHVRLEGKGRSCKSCHEVHASSQPLHIRAKVPFGTGGWQLPIRYTRTDNGGSCVVGCHKPKAYDRENPVDYSK